MQIYYNTNFANIILLILLLIILSDHTFDGTKLFLTHDIAILSKRLKPGNIKSQLSKILLDQYLRSSFELCWVQIFLWVKLYMRQTCILFNWFWQFLFEHSVTHVHGLSVYVKEGASFYRLISGKIWRFLCFWQALLHSLLYFFFCCQSPSSSLCIIFDASGHSAFIRQHAMKSLPSICPSNHLSLSFLKIR